MAGGKSDYLEAADLDRVFGATAYSVPGTLYFGLLLDTNTQAQRDAGTFTEVSGNNYSRVAVTNNTTNFPAHTGTAPTAKTNGTAITWSTPSASWGAVHAVSCHDAASSGNLLWWMDLLGTEVLGTADATSDAFTSPAHGFSNGDLVKFSSVPGLAVPTGLTDGAYYFIVSAATDTFKLSLTSGGSAINLTGSGGGKVGKDLSQTPGPGSTVQIAASALALTED